jgi:tetratricopeptide (TPR) repeat protein
MTNFGAPPVANSWCALGMLASATLIAGCAAGPARVDTARPPGPSASGASGPAAATLAALAALEHRQRVIAEAAAAQGRWADAIGAWDVILALDPADSRAATRRSQAEVAAQAAVAERLPRARAAQQRGDGDTATRLWLEVLALAPLHAEAAGSLRAIERARAERSASLLAARLKPAPRPAASDPGYGLASNNALEHASLLAGQGDIAAAIAMLQPLASGRQTEPALRAMLAELYLRQAEQLAGSDRAAAIALLERCLALRPEASQAAQAQQRLNELRRVVPRRAGAGPG